MNNTHEEFREAINQAMFGEQEKKNEKTNKESLFEKLKGSKAFLCAGIREDGGIVGALGSIEELTYMLSVIINSLNQKGVSYEKILATVLNAHANEQKFKENAVENELIY